MHCAQHVPTTHPFLPLLYQQARKASHTHAHPWTTAMPVCGWSPCVAQGHVAEPVPYAQQHGQIQLTNTGQPTLLPHTHHGTAGPARTTAQASGPHTCAKTPCLSCTPSSMPLSCPLCVAVKDSMPVAVDATVTRPQGCIFCSMTWHCRTADAGNCVQPHNSHAWPRQASHNLACNASKPMPPCPLQKPPVSLYRTLHYPWQQPPGQALNAS